MARREKELPELEPDDWSPDADDSLLIRSAESLGRVIGTLQRELDKATTKLFKVDGVGSNNGHKRPAARKRVKRVARPAAARTVKTAKPRTARKTTARKATTRKAPAKKK